MPSIRVLLVDDHAIVRAGIRSLMERMADVQVISEARNGREALQFLKTRAADIDVVVLDVSMTELDGLATTGYITQDYPHVRVLILSMHTTETYVLPAVRAGAAGYVPKSATREELELALKTVACGQSYLSPVVAQYVTSEVRRLSDSQNETGIVFLRPHEHELLQLIAEGYSTKEIATRLHVTPKAIESRRVRLMERLGVHDMVGLVRSAIRLGIIQSDA